MGFKRFFSKRPSNYAAVRHFRNFMYWPFLGITWLPAGILFKSHVGEMTPINGESMYPTFNADFYKNMRKDICWTDKKQPTKNLERGMVVSVRQVTGILINKLLTTSEIHLILKLFKLNAF